MIHAVFNRPSNELKIFDGAALRYTFEASGSAWGDGGPNAPYGHDCQIAPGHYRLVKVEEINPPIISEGPGQIYVADLTQSVAETCGEQLDNGQFSMGGLLADIGNLAKYNRSAIMLHGGGSNLGLPAALGPDQPLCKTYGCTRLHNADLKVLMNYLLPKLKSGLVIIFTVIGDSAPCQC